MGLGIERSGDVSFWQLISSLSCSSLIPRSSPNESVSKYGSAFTSDNVM